MNGDVEQLIKVVSQLPEDKVSEVLDFARFLAWQHAKESGTSTPFEQWAERLAQERGFADLSEEDVAAIVHESRRTRE